MRWATHARRRQREQTSVKGLEPTQELLVLEKEEEVDRAALGKDPEVDNFIVNWIRLL